MQNYTQKFKEIARLAQTNKGRIVIGGLVALWIVVGWLTASPMEVCWPRRGTAVSAVTGSVRVLAESEFVLTSPVAGAVAFAKPLEPTGLASVAKGEVVVQMDTTQLDREVALFKTSEETLRKRVELGSPVEGEILNARAELTNAESLYAAGQYSKLELERRRREVEKLERVWMSSQLELESQLAAARYELQSRQERLEQMSIKSPIDGLFFEPAVVAGQTVSAGSFVGKVRTRGLLVEVRVAEEDFAGIAAGAPVKLSFNGLPAPVDGVVSAISASSNPDTRQRVAYVKLTTPSSDIVPGSTGYATLIKAKRDNALIVPRRAVVGDKVFVEFFGHLWSRSVKIGYQSFNAVEILEGLGDFERVALPAETALRNSMGVHPIEVKPL